MKIHLSGVDHSWTQDACCNIIKRKGSLLYNLVSFYYIQKNQTFDRVDFIRDHSQSIMVDSGAHSFQFGVKVDWEEYTKDYAKYITRFDRANVAGYFEMDIENIIGYENVKKLRKILEEKSDKIIPVWHPERGIEEYHKMCEDYKGKIIAIGGFKNTDIKDEQYLSFLKYAKRYDCKVHCLGMTRKKVLDKVPFDFTDSASWAYEVIYGKLKQKEIVKKLPRAVGYDKNKQYEANYLQAMTMQEYYYKKWRKECKD